MVVVAVFVVVVVAKEEVVIGVVTGRGVCEDLVVRLWVVGGRFRPAESIDLSPWSCVVVAVWVEAAVVEAVVVRAACAVMLTVDVGLEVRAFEAWLVANVLD